MMDGEMAVGRGVVKTPPFLPLLVLETEGSNKQTIFASSCWFGYEKDP